MVEITIIVTQILLIIQQFLNQLIIKTSSVAYLYAQNIKTNIPAPGDQPTVCFTDMKPLSTQYKNLVRAGLIQDLNIQIHILR